MKREGGEGGGEREGVRGREGKSKGEGSKEGRQKGEGGRG